MNLDGTDSFCFLINDTSTSLTKATLEDIQWYLYRNCDIDILSLEQKHIVELERLKIEETERKEMEIKRKEEEEEQALVEKVCFGIMGVMAVIIVIALIISTLNK